jgi:chromosomal replication initiation ATPase DnaA
LRKLKENLGEAEFNAWFKRAHLELREEGWFLLVERRFHADYIKGQFKQQLDWAARAIGLEAVRVDVTKKVSNVTGP